MIAAEFAGFLGLPVLRSSSITDLTEAVVGVCTKARTSLVLVDEIHNISLQTRTGADASDTLKYFSERIPATFAYAGIDIEDSSLLTGTRGDQIAARFTAVDTHPFPYNTEWKALGAQLEANLLLHQHKPDTLTRLDRFLHTRTGGMIGTLSHQLRGAAVDAILTGTEKIIKPDCWPSTSTSPPAVSSPARRMTSSAPDTEVARLPFKVRPRQGDHHPPRQGEPPSSRLPAEIPRRTAHAPGQSDLAPRCRRRWPRPGRASADPEHNRVQGMRSPDPAQVDVRRQTPDLLEGPADKGDTARDTPPASGAGNPAGSAAKSCGCRSASAVRSARRPADGPPTSNDSNATNRPSRRRALRRADDARARNAVVSPPTAGEQDHARSANSRYLLAADSHGAARVQPDAVSGPTGHPKKHERQHARVPSRCRDLRLHPKRSGRGLTPSP
ncbi:hypothetical protein ACIREM_15275 [Streptomyces shenzhenensis]|uniref:hypothetical protein n=1 Tax=Streptomyces shenzhenensis TaxID=943815 RepID=UPI00381BE78D